MGTAQSRCHQARQDAAERGAQAHVKEWGVTAMHTCRLLTHFPLTATITTAI